MFWGTVTKKGNSRALFEAWTFVPGTVCDRERLAKPLNGGPKRGDRGTLDGDYHQVLTTCAYTHRLGKSEIRYH